MSIFPRLVLGAALAAMAALPAQAGNIFIPAGGSLKDSGLRGTRVPEPVYIADRHSGWYLRGSIGYTISGDPELKELPHYPLDKDEAEDSWIVEAGVGFYATGNLRTDITVGFRDEARVRGYGGTPGTEGRREFNVRNTFVLANVYYDFGERWGMRPYVGVGVGSSLNETNVIQGTVPGSPDCDECGIFGNGDDEFSFAWALMAGVSSNIAHNWIMDIGYRYLDLGSAPTHVLDARIDDGAPHNEPDESVTIRGIDADDLTSHEFRVGVRYDIW